MPGRQASENHKKTKEQPWCFILREPATAGILARRVAEGLEMLLYDLNACIKAGDTAPVNPVFYRFFVKADAFRATDACTGCGRCVELCPLNNVHLKNGKPVWGKNCTHCMACICYCPKEAIEYSEKSKGKPRHHVEAPEKKQKDV